MVVKGGNVTYRMKWTIVLTVIGVAMALATYASTGSFWWAVAALLATGILANAVAAPYTQGRSR